MTHVKYEHLAVACRHGRGWATVAVRLPSPLHGTLARPPSRRLLPAARRARDARRTVYVSIRRFQCVKIIDRTNRRSKRFVEILLQKKFCFLWVSSWMMMSVWNYLMVHAVHSIFFPKFLLHVLAFSCDVLSHAYVAMYPYVFTCCFVTFCENS